MAPRLACLGMSEITQILSAIEAGEMRTAEQLLPLVYEELRKLAAARMAQEKPGATLQATVLVHEAWLRLAGSDRQQWRGRSHFFGAAAEAMRLHSWGDVARQTMTVYEQVVGAAPSAP